MMIASLTSSTRYDAAHARSGSFGDVIEPCDEGSSVLATRDASPPSSGAEGLTEVELRNGFRIGRIEGGRLVGAHPAAR
jgi:hypothetical protein